MSREQLIKERRDETIFTIPEICSERARLVTQVYQETEGFPILIRRAKALEKILSEMAIFIRPGELIVGSQTGKLKGTPIFPEFSVH